MTFVQTRLATPADDSALRRLLRENPFPGSISLSFEREPNYFLASSMEGPFHQTMVVCESKSGDMIGMGDRSIRARWVNGEVKEVGYLSGLRTDSKYSHGLAMGRFVQLGFDFYRQAHAHHRTEYYLISIVEENLAAKRLLTSNLNGIPHLNEYARMSTYAIRPTKRKIDIPLPNGFSLRRGTVDVIPDIVDCLNRCGREQQFALYWTNETLLSDLTPALAIEDFFLVCEKERVVGCIALWNQQSFKQTVIRGYKGSMARFRKWINWFAPLGGWPNLPEVGTKLNQCFACFTAIDNNDPTIFAALIRVVHNEAAARGYDYFIIGLAESNPLTRILKSYRPVVYPSQIYLAAWDEAGNRAIQALDPRPPSLEVAVL